MKISEIPPVVFSEVMRDVDLAVSVAHAGSVDPETSHSTIEMRSVLVELTMPLFHFNNVKVEGNRFHETSHLSADGSLDLYEIVKALQDVGFDGYIRPDHGRMLWGEVARPGYGLYDRALGAAYLNGLWEAVAKSR